MAAVTGTISSVRQLDDVAGLVTDSSSDRIKNCVIFVSFTGTYATSDDGTVAAVPTAIQNSRRDGKTVAVRGYAPYSPGLEGTTPIAALGSSISYSGTTLTCALTDGTLAAEHGAATLSTFTRDIGIFINYELDD